MWFPFDNVKVNILGFGILGFGGIVSLLLGSLFLIDPAASDLTISLSVILPTVLTLGGIMFVISVFVVKAIRKKTSIGVEALVGQTGTVEIDFSVWKGKVFVDGDYWNAQGEDALKKGDTVIVTDRHGMVLLVKKQE